jgi:hypothetical protein
MLGCMTRLALYTGMRAGEIQTLLRDRISLYQRKTLLTSANNSTALQCRIACGQCIPLSGAASPEQQIIQGGAKGG